MNSHGDISVHNAHSYVCVYYASGLFFPLPANKPGARCAVSPPGRRVHDRAGSSWPGWVRLSSKVSMILR